MAEIDRQQASRQKQAPEKQRTGAPKRAAPQTAAAFLQALLAGAGVGSRSRCRRRETYSSAGIGNSALAALAAGPNPSGRQMPLPPEACGTEPLEIEASAPAGSPGARLAGAAPAGYGGGQPPEPWGTGVGMAVFCTGVTGGAARWNRGKRRGCRCLFWNTAACCLKPGRAGAFSLPPAGHGLGDRLPLPEGPGGGLWPLSVPCGKGKGPRPVQPVQPAAGPRQFF